MFKSFRLAHRYRSPPKKKLTACCPPPSLRATSAHSPHGRHTDPTPPSVDGLTRVTLPRQEWVLPSSIPRHRFPLCQLPRRTGGHVLLAEMTLRSRRPTKNHHGTARDRGHPLVRACGRLLLRSKLARRRLRRRRPRCHSDKHFCCHPSPAILAMPRLAHALKCAGRARRHPPPRRCTRVLLKLHHPALRRAQRRPPRRPPRPRRRPRRPRPHARSPCRPRRPRRHLRLPRRGRCRFVPHQPLCCRL